MSVVDVYDNVLEDHITELISMQLRELVWKYDYKSNKNAPGKHWHRFCGHNSKEVIENGFEWVQPIWETAKFKLDFKTKYYVDDYVRIYCNAHTHGLEPHMHVDDGDFTMIYYPRLDWKDEWGGGTLIDGQLVPYVGNRLVVFDAFLNHKALPVSRQCYELRSVIVIKANVSGGNRERLDYYKD